MTVNIEARSTGLGYCHGYKQPDEHYHDEWEEMQTCKQTPYWHDGQAYSYDEYVALRPHAVTAASVSGRQAALRRYEGNATARKGGK